RKLLDRGSKLDSGVVDDDVDRTERAVGCLDQVRDLRGARHVSRMESNFGVGCSFESCSLMLKGLSVAQAVQHDRAPLFGKCSGYAQSDAARGAGYYCAFACKQIVVPSLRESYRTLAVGSFEVAVGVG